MSENIRPLSLDDQAFLWEMLYQAIFVPEGESPPPRDILHQPDIAHYVENWGLPHDAGFVAEMDGQPVGAAWIRLLTGENRGYGYVDDQTPEVSIALLPDYRGKGIGSALMVALMDFAESRYSGLSLSVSPDNPAKRLYDRLGFVVVGDDGSSLIMHKRF